MTTEDNKNSEKEEDSPFWGEDPNILFDKQYLLEFFPTENMSFNRKLNALSRSVIILTFILFIFTRTIRILFVSAFTLLSIYILHQSNNSKLNSEEGFSDNDELMKEIKYNQEIIQSNKKSPALELIKQNQIPISDNTFQLPSSKNPFSNILVTDYSDNPNKKAAPPSDNLMVGKDIINRTKQLVQEQNPDQHDISDKIFKDLNDKLNFEQSLRSFNSTPGTTIPNDQSAFAEFCYGSMVSCKEGNLFACARNLTNHQNI
jgi:hypothetical protein